jgi:WD40 repeat protein
MITVALLVILAFGFTPSKPLQHEKSFYVQDELKVADYIGFYGRSMLINTENDVIQRDLVTGAVQRTFRAHTNIVSAFVVVDGSIMYTIGLDLLLAIWDLASGSIIKRVFLGPEATVPLCLEVFNNKAYIGTQTNKIIMVDLIAGRTIRARDMGRHVMAISRFSDHLYASGQFTPLVQKLDLNTLETIQSYIGHSGSVSYITFNLGVLYTCSSDRNVLGFDVDSGINLKSFIGHDTWVSCAVFDGNNLYSSDDAGEIIHWDINTAEIVRRFPPYHLRQIEYLALHDGFLFSSAVGVIARWNLITYSVDFTYRGTLNALNVVAIWKNYVLGAGTEGVIRFWDSEARSFEPVYTLSAQSRSIITAFVTDDTLYSVDSSSIRKWDLKSLLITMTITVPTGSVSSLFYQGEFVFAGATDGMFRKWNSSTGSLVLEFELQSIVNEIGYYKDVLFTASTSELITWWSPQDFTILLQKVAPTTRLNRIYINNDVVYACGFSLASLDSTTGETLKFLDLGSFCYDIVGTEEYLILATDDTRIQLRDPQTFERFASLRDAKAISLCLDSSNTLYSTGSEGSIKRWNLESRSVAFSFEGENFHVIIYFRSEWGCHCACCIWAKIVGWLPPWCNV